MNPNPDRIREFAVHRRGVLRAVSGGAVAAGLFPTATAARADPTTAELGDVLTADLDCEAGEVTFTQNTGLRGTSQWIVVEVTATDSGEPSVRERLDGASAGYTTTVSLGRPAPLDTGACFSVHAARFEEVERAHRSARVCRPEEGETDAEAGTTAELGDLMTTELDYDEVTEPTHVDVTLEQDLAPNEWMTVTASNTFAMGRHGGIERFPPGSERGDTVVAYSYSSGLAPGRYFEVEVRKRADVRREEASGEVCCPGDGGEGSPTRSPFAVSVACDAERPARLRVENTGDEAYELRDIDDEGVDALDGRPVVGAGESFVTAGVPDGTAVLQAFDPDTGAEVGPRVEADVACDGRADRPLRVHTDGAGVVTVANAGARTVEVRDLDDEGGDLVSGRPLVRPDERLEFTGVDDGTYVLQAFDPDDGTAVAPPVEVRVGSRS